MRNLSQGTFAAGVGIINSVTYDRNTSNIQQLVEGWPDLVTFDRLSKYGAIWVCPNTGYAPDPLLHHHFPCSLSNHRTFVFICGLNKSHHLYLYLFIYIYTYSIILYIYIDISLKHTHCPIGQWPADMTSCQAEVDLYKSKYAKLHEMVIQTPLGRSWRWRLIAPYQSWHRFSPGWKFEHHFLRMI